MCKKLIYLVSFILVLSLALASGTKAADPNLVGWWSLNEGSGDTAIDLSGSGNDGTVSNLNGGLGLDGSVWVDDPERGTVISFNGTADGAFVRAGDIPQMTLTNDFTWAFWAKHSAENTADNDIILGNRMDENTVDFVPRQFIKFTPTKFEWHMNGNGDDNLDYDDIPADIWLHHAVVKTGDQLTYYRNGIEASSGTFTQPLDFPQPLFFGGDNEAAEGENWSGLMSEVRIYNRALTGLEILAVTKGVERIDMEISFTAQPPVLDGQVDEIWANASTQYFVPLDDPANGSGSWMALYDSENLYVIVDITDDSLQNDSDGSWQDDSVELYFDGGNTKLNTPLSGDDHQYTFGWTTDEIQGTNIDGATEGMEHAQVDTDTGWRIEIKMPWLSIQGAAPEAGGLIGIDCYYNDDDDGGDSREGKMLGFSAVEGWNDASQWGTAVLTADRRVDVSAPGDAIQGVPNDGLMDGENFGWPEAETPDLAFDDDILTKFLHFKGELEPTGFQIEPASGASVVTGLTFTTANDATERDPISFELSGSNDSIDGPYELIASGDIVDLAQETEWPRFTMNVTPISFDNDVAYKYYQIMFPAVRDAGSANSMQIAEVELLGELDVSADIAAINELYNQATLACGTGDVELYLPIFTEDAVVMATGFPPMIGKEVLRPTFEGLFGQFDLELPYTVDEIGLRGDWAFGRSSFQYSMTPKEGGETTTSPGKQLDIFKRQADGSWKIYIECWNYGATPTAGKMAVTSWGPGLAMAQDDDADAMYREMCDLYTLAVETGDIDLYVANYTDDGVQMPPDEPSRIGSEQIRAAMEPALALFNAECPIYPQYAEVTGDWAFGSCYWSLSLTPKEGGETTTFDGKGMDVLKRQADGSWKYYISCWNYNGPPTVE